MVREKESTQWAVKMKSLVLLMLLTLPSQVCLCIGIILIEAGHVLPNMLIVFLPMF